VADFTGAVVLTGEARPARDELTLVALDAGGEVASTDQVVGRVAVSLYPWDLVIEPPGEARHGSAQNRLAAKVVSVTRVGGRVRLGLDAGQPMIAEVTELAVRDLDLRPGESVMACWKASATRLIEL
jgi:molybdopterin-binding protein